MIERRAAPPAAPSAPPPSPARTAVPATSTATPSRDALRARLGVSTQAASDLLRQVRASQETLPPGVSRIDPARRGLGTAVLAAARRTATSRHADHGQPVTRVIPARAPPQTGMDLVWT
jgi:hypothetical protein